MLRRGVPHGTSLVVNHNGVQPPWPNRRAIVATTSESSNAIHVNLFYLTGRPAGWAGRTISKATGGPTNDTARGDRPRAVSDFRAPWQLESPAASTTGAASAARSGAACATLALLPGVVG